MPRKAPRQPMASATSARGVVPASVPAVPIASRIAENWAKRSAVEAGEDHKGTHEHRRAADPDQDLAEGGGAKLRGPARRRGNPIRPRRTPGSRSVADPSGPAPRRWGSGRRRRPRTRPRRACPGGRGRAPDRPRSQAPRQPGRYGRTGSARRRRRAQPAWAMRPRTIPSGEPEAPHQAQDGGEGQHGDGEHHAYRSRWQPQLGHRERPGVGQPATQQHEAQEMQQPEGPVAQLDQQQKDEAKGRELGEVGMRPDVAP